MRILHVTSDWKWTGPAEPMLMALLALRARGHEVDLVCPDAPVGDEPGVLAEAQARGITAALVLARGRGIRPLRDARDGRRLRALAGADASLGRAAADVVHVWHTRAHGLALRALGRWRTTALVRAHSDGVEPGNAPWSRWLFAAGADGLACASVDCARSHAALRGGSPAMGVLGAVDPGRFRPGAGRGRMRQALGIAVDAPLIGVVARAQPQRRFDLLFDAWSRVVRHRPSARLAILARGSRFDSVVRAPIERLGLGDSVVLAGHLRGEDYVDLLGSLGALCLLVPGSDAGCRAVLEAAGCGVPSVVSPRGALPELVTHGQTGLVCEETTEALAAGLTRVLDDADLRTRLAAGALARARTGFAPERLAADCESLYGAARASRRAALATHAVSSPWSATSSR